MRLDRDAGPAEQFRPARFLGLDGLRGVAALVVVYLHADLTFHVGYQPGTASLAVDFFFMLSGFVLAHAYDGRFQQGMTWQDFMRVRLIRLYPMLFLGSVLGAIVFLVAQHQRHLYHGAVNAWMIAGSFLMLPVGIAVDDSNAYPLNIAYWSLFFELIANAAYATHWARKPLRTLGFVALGFAVATAVMTFASRPYIFNGVTASKFLWGFVRVAYPFTTGLLLYRLRHRWARISEWKIITGARWWLTATILAVALILPIDSPWCDLALSFVVFPLLIIAAASLNLSAASQHLCATLGRLSYPIYILPWPIYRLLHGATQTLRLDSAPWVPTLIGAVATILLAPLTLKLWDEPVRRWFVAEPWSMRFHYGHRKIRKS